MTRQEFHKTLASLLLAQTELEMASGVIFEDGYRELAKDLDNASIAINTARWSLIKYRREEAIDGTL